MSGTNGKVVLVDNSTPLTCNGGSIACSADQLSHITDVVGYGNANFFETAAAPAASSTLALFRKDGGRQDGDNNASDFATGAPAPRNRNSPLLPPASSLSAAILPNNATVPVGTPVTFGVSATNGGSPATVTAVTWSSSNQAVVDALTVGGDPGLTATATPLAKGTTTITAAVTTSIGPVTASVTLTVVGSVATVTVSPATFSVTVGATKTFAATALDSDGQPASTNITWSSLDPNIATIDAASGLATAKAAGTVTIRATSSNGKTGDASLTVTSADNGPIVPTTTFVSEFHYDNIGTDANEAIEIESPAGTSFTGWSLVLYDGATGNPYTNGSTWSLTALHADDLRQPAGHRREFPRERSAERFAGRCDANCAGWLGDPGRSGSRSRIRIL